MVTSVDAVLASLEGEESWGEDVLGKPFPPPPWPEGVRRVGICRRELPRVWARPLLLCISAVVPVSPFCGTVYTTVCVCVCGEQGPLTRSGIGKAYGVGKPWDGGAGPGSPDLAQSLRSLTLLHGISLAPRGSEALSSSTMRPWLCKLESEYMSRGRTAPA